MLTSTVCVRLAGHACSQLVQHLREHAEASADDEIAEVPGVMDREVRTIQQLQNAVRWQTSSILRSNGGRSSRDTTTVACDREGAVT